MKTEGRSSERYGAKKTNGDPTQNSSEIDRKVSGVCQVTTRTNAVKQAQIGTATNHVAFQACKAVDKRGPARIEHLLSRGPTGTATDTYLLLPS